MNSPSCIFHRDLGASRCLHCKTVGRCLHTDVLLTLWITGYPSHSKQRMLLKLIMVPPKRLSICFKQEDDWGEDSGGDKKKNRGLSCLMMSDSSLSFRSTHIHTHTYSAVQNLNQPIPRLVTDQCKQSWYARMINGRRSVKPNAMIWGFMCACVWILLPWSIRWFVTKGWISSCYIFPQYACSVFTKTADKDDKEKHRRSRNLKWAITSFVLLDYTLSQKHLW